MSLTTLQPTLREALTAATTQLNRSPDLRADAARDALLLLLHTLAISRASLLAHPERILKPAEQAAYDVAILRRLANEPIQHITRNQEFYGLALEVSPAVLIPRPETETLVESVLAEFARNPDRTSLNSPLPSRVASRSARSVSPEALRPARTEILDVGTGSGAIAIALAHYLPETQFTAVDISPAALEIASINVAHHDLASRIHLLRSDLLDALPSGEIFDAIVSNPPYIPTTERNKLHPQVRDFEPEVALYAGPAGLEIYRRLIPQAGAALKPNGLLALEIGYNQRDAIAEMFADWCDLRFVDDLQGIPRVALARKP
jgi:release factor glutamine methyltransferase